MTARFHKLLFLSSAWAIAACSSERTLEPTQADPPKQPPVFSAFTISPPSAVITEWDELKLTAVASDQSGNTISTAGRVSYLSDKPGVAFVTSDGTVTGNAPGTATISATMTIGEITRASRMTVIVDPRHPLTNGGSCVASRPCIAFAREGSIFTTSLDDSPPRLLLENATRPSWSPDGATIAFTRPENYKLLKWQVCLAAWDGTGVRCLVGEQDGNVVGGPSWSPDGTHVAFSTYTYPCSGVCFSRLMLLDTRTLQTTIIGTNQVMSLAWAPDGRTIAFAAWGLGPYGGGALYVMDADGSNLRFIGQSLNPYSVKRIAWSPDGRRLALAMDNENACPWDCDTALGVVNADGTAFQLLATAYTDPEDLYIDFPAWSTDGSLLTYTVSGPCYDSDPGCATEIRVWDFASRSSRLFVPNAAAASWRP